MQRCFPATRLLLGVISHATASAVRYPLVLSQAGQRAWARAVQTSSPKQPLRGSLATPGVTWTGISLCDVIGSIPV
jgi:hypothetical protein